MFEYHLRVQLFWKLSYRELKITCQLDKYVKILIYLDINLVIADRLVNEMYEIQAESSYDSNAVIQALDKNVPMPQLNKDVVV